MQIGNMKPTQTERGAVSPKPPTSPPNRNLNPNPQPLLPFALALVLLATPVAPAQGGLSSLYVFGDGVSTTTNNINPSVAYLYYGHRFCNGRVWVEVLAQRQGLPYDPARNWSYFGHYSTELVANLNRFTAPDAGTALVVVWVSDADFVYTLNNIDPPYNTNLHLPTWTAAINQSLTNHWLAIQSLYAKGARQIVMPNAVDISKVPYYAYLASADQLFVRQRVIDFNTGFAALINQARASLPGLTIHVPDFFAVLDDIWAHPADYGLVNPGIDAVDDPALADKSLNGPGTNYVFWDYLDPTAKSHAIMADIAQQIISPVRIENVVPVGTNNRLDLVNVPVGRNGFVDTSTDLANWMPGPAITSTHASQSVFVPATGPSQFYRLRFPSSWTWP